MIQRLHERHLPVSKLAGVPVARLGFSACLAQAGAWLAEPGFRRIATANVDFLTQAAIHAELHEALSTADMVTADGQPLVWLSRMTGESIPERVPGSDLVLPLLRAAVERGVSVFLLGATPDVVARVRERCRHEMPGLRIAGSHTAHVDVDDRVTMSVLATRIRRTGAGLLLVALGCPKQELFLSRYGEVTGARVGIGIGAGLDFVGGRSRRAPRLLQSLGLEWAHRLMREPRRLSGRYARNFTYLARLTWRLTRERLTRRAPNVRPST